MPLVNRSARMKARLRAATASIFLPLSRWHGGIAPVVSCLLPGPALTFLVNL